VTGGRGSGNLADALREAREDQFTTNDGARLGVPNIAVILTASPSFLSTQVSRKSLAIVIIMIVVVVVVVVVVVLTAAAAAADWWV